MPLEEIPRKTFKVVYADPPWQFKAWSHRGEGRGASQYYTCMDLKQICALPIKEIVTDDAALFLWVVQPQLPEAMEVIKAWGFEFKTVAFCWIKMPKSWTPNMLLAEPKMGLGYHTRSGMEQCWLAIRGRGYEKKSRGIRQVVFSPIREHSRKPDEVAENIVKLVGDVPRIELFARTKRSGWENWGAEVGKFG